jgi:predicted DNA-binding transcriptional regulator YafY
MSRVPVTRMPLARMELIYRAIKTQRRPNCSSLAQKLEVSAKTVQRDIDYMRYQLNLPIEYDKERHGFYFTEQVTHFPAVHVTESELVSLLVARKAVEQYANTPFQKPLTEAFQKLTTGLVAVRSVAIRSFPHRLVEMSWRVLRRHPSVHVPVDLQLIPTDEAYTSGNRE